MMKRPVGDLGIHERIVIKMDLKEVGCEDVYWIHLAQHTTPSQVLMSTVMNLWVSEMVGNVLPS
jgi:hypothetical protein